MLLPYYCGGCFYHFNVSFCYGRCYCHIIVVDVFTTLVLYLILFILADVIANYGYGRSYCHMFCG